MYMTGKLYEYRMMVMVGVEPSRGGGLSAQRAMKQCCDIPCAPRNISALYTSQDVETMR